MSTYQLSIITPEGVIYKDTIQSLVAPGANGSFGVLANHAPMMVALLEGVLKINDLKQEFYFALRGNILEVDSKSNVIILSDKAVSCKTFDEAKVKVQEIKAEFQNSTT